MEEIRKCKILDVREFKKKYGYSYHIILKDLNTKERFSLAIVDDYIMCFSKFFFSCMNYALLVKDDIVNMKIDSDESIIFEILEKESEA